MKKILLAFVAIIFILSACNNSKTENNVSTNGEKENSKDDKKENATQVLNNISIDTDGDVEVYRTFLSYEDGSMVSSSNKTALGRPVYLNLNITKGWYEANGEVSLGASEKISTDNGTVILDAPDLFSTVPSLNAKDAKFVRLKAVITNLSGPIEYFVVDYKVWDKKGNGVIKGSYKLYVE